MNTCNNCIFYTKLFTKGEITGDGENICLEDEGICQLKDEDTSSGDLCILHKSK